jgi:hypothetical protein
MGMTPSREQGIEVGFEETEDGALVRFTVTPDPTAPRIASLRGRVAGWAERHARFAASIAADAGSAPTEAQECTNGGPALPPSLVTAEEIDAGARLRFTAVDRRQIADLRSRVRSYADRIASGDCRLIGQP